MADYVPSWQKAPTLADRPRGGWPDVNTKVKTRLDERKADTAWDKKQWASAKAIVWKRDEGKDRMTRHRVVKTLALDPKRGEVHHIEGRENQALRYDPRNLLLLALETHEKVTRYELRVVGTRFFKHEGKRYIDATDPVKFVKVRCPGE